jgi:hypothetical protein
MQKTMTATILLDINSPVYEVFSSDHYGLFTTFSGCTYISLSRVLQVKYSACRACGFSIIYRVCLPVNPDSIHTFFQVPRKNHIDFSAKRVHYLAKV